ncbi:hypothetical protein FACS189425_08120 [Clostridia bacterium]|nr:hypothetical protein FACS189425_08120 [Clostridia bacterium]
MDVKKAVAIGRFDGVHVAHQQLIREIVKSKYTSCALIIETGENTLTSSEEKARIMHALGVDMVETVDFSSVRDLPYTKFFDEYIIHRLNAGKVVVGYNFTFGKDKLGTVCELVKLCEKAGVELCVIEPFKMDEEIVSSSKIRELIVSGDSERAEKFLGRENR